MSGWGIAAVLLQHQLEIRFQRQPTRLCLGISIIGLVLVYGTMDLQELVRGQGKNLGGWIPLWGIVVQPVAFFVFLTAALAETKRIPFDMPEGESEVIGYFVEYSGMKFGMFFLADFLETIMVACLATTLFFGGWQVPYLLPDGFRYDQLMRLGWLGLFPIAVANVLVTAVVLAFFSEGFSWP